MKFKEDNAIYKGLVVEICDDPNDINYNKVKVRIPSRMGGTNAYDRVPDEQLPWMLTTIKFTKGKDEGAVVVVAFDGGDASSPIIIGRLIV